MRSRLRSLLKLLSCGKTNGDGVESASEARSRYRTYVLIFP